ncbi:DUF5347 family protein [Rouxiella badensis]|uniref:DUF5347 family protein n=1 Tax=Rouxiella badensis TaxID=1646377 RepID=UPI001D1583EB|nr:DUF5347 family protein [Rouxiella badensis]MCC3704141.1 DUF5347 family protein [Rouxiella badensis]
MLLANEKQREIGIKHISRMKEMINARKNIAQETFDTSTPHMRKVICIAAELKERHLNMKFHELSFKERLKVVVALNSLIDLTSLLPRFVSVVDCEINTNH